MTDETKKHASEDTPPPADIGETFDAETLAGLSEEDDAPDNTEALFVLIDGLKGENADLKDRYLRLAADMDNLRRRTERDVKDAKSYAIANFARDMLAVSDNLRRGLDAVPAEAKAGGEGGLAGLIEGVEVTERAMLAALERHGVRKIDPKGQKFDPNFHQAMFEMPNPDVPNNTVMQVVQDGYVIGERVLRPAMVGVAKGGPKNADAPQPAEAAPREAEPQTGDAEPGAPNAESEKDA